jgi:hypothetical protein
MHAHRMHVTIPEDRRVMVELPDDVPTGLVELIVLIPEEREEPRATASPEALARWDEVTAEIADWRSFRELTLEERRARLRRLRGIGKGLLPSSEEFQREKAEEADLEERKFAR